METTAPYSPVIEKPQKRELLGGMPALVILAFLSDLITPFFIWKGILPAEFRWISYAAIAIMFGLSLARVIVFNHIPRVIWFVLAVSLIWGIVAVAQGQGIAPTGWGWWLFFQFPLVGLFVFLQPGLPKRLGDGFRVTLLVILAIELVFQLVEYALGQAPGDDLTGSFGKSQSGPLALFTLLLDCLFFGDWIANKRWKGLLIALALTMLSNVLAENKLFPLAILILGIIAVIFFSARYGSLPQMMIFLILLAVAFIGFDYLYNAVIPDANRVPLLSYVTDPARLNRYLNFTGTSVSYGSYYVWMGRNYAFDVGWKSLQRDPMTLLLGYGLGARSESRTLGTSGVGFNTGFEGLSVGTSLTVMMQEWGLLGLAVIAGFFIWVIVMLGIHIRKNPQSPAMGTRYAILLFTMLWPLWLWYTTTWTVRVVMLLYWAAIGYVFAEAWQDKYQAYFANKMKGLGLYGR